ncbi:MAG TPA: prepilin-type N-terminal cleavage/methylation domain-containing protein [Pyrinomonadaceae bacterium]|jgi:prepilin-type N-terminal cleavage/methylation domain-containing protein
MSRGFSLVELLIVLSVITILLGISLFYLSGHENLYRPDEQALKIIDALQEARQRSLTQREVMRVEIDLTDNQVRLIEENESSTADDDRLVRNFVLAPRSQVRVDSRPSDINTNPSEILPVPPAQFRTSVHPLSAGHDVCTFRFLRNGTVVNEGTNATGSNATTAGLTLFVWSPKTSDQNASDIARAVTIIGGTGSVRLWEYNRNLTGTNKWQDSRRRGVSGGSISGTEN